VVLADRRELGVWFPADGEAEFLCVCNFSVKVRRIVAVVTTHKLQSKFE
jgi:hypothetical protein